MGNDYPDAVYASEEAANAYVAQKRAEASEAVRKRESRMVYRRAHEFEVRT